MIDQAVLHDHLLSYDDVWVDQPFDERSLVYKIGRAEDGKGKFFAIIEDGSRPTKLSLKCDPQLAEVLRDKYESVLPGYHLNKKHWNTILCTGQIPLDELHDLIRLSYQLVAK